MSSSSYYLGSFARLKKKKLNVGLKSELLYLPAHQSLHCEEYFVCVFFQSWMIEKRIFVFKTTEKIHFSKSFQNLELCILPCRAPLAKENVSLQFSFYYFSWIYCIQVIKFNLKSEIFNMYSNLENRFSLTDFLLRTCYKTFPIRFHLILLELNFFLPKLNAIIYRLGSTRHL